MRPKEESPRRIGILGLFFIVSILLHLVLVALIFLLHEVTPKQKFPAHKTPPGTLTLSFIPPPKSPAHKPPQPQFLPTQPDNSPANPHAQVQSDNNSRMHTDSNKARKPDSILPDLNGHAPGLNYITSAPSPPVKNPGNPANPASAQNQPQGKPDGQKVPKLTDDQKKPAPKAPKVPKPDATKPPTPQVAQNTFDPNGLPVLPPLNAPTLAPPAPLGVDQPKTTPQDAAQPPPSFTAARSDNSGAAGLLGPPSPEAMATDLGRYKAKIYRAVGGRWYSGIGDKTSLIGVGFVRIQYTIHSDGTVEAHVEEDNGNNVILRDISLNSILDSAPFDPFTDAMRQQVGDSITDEFTFQVY